MDFSCTNPSSWKSALWSYETSLDSLQKPDLIPLDNFYRKELPLLIRQREPQPFITQPELRRLLQWKLSRGKWRPRLLDFVSSLSETLVESASKRAFMSLPDLSKAVSELTVLKGIGPATASAVLAAYAPEVAPFMSDEVSLEMDLGRTYWIYVKDDSFGCFEGYASDFGQCKRVYPEAVPLFFGEVAEKGKGQHCFF